jgi:hypothetical protein
MKRREFITLLANVKRTPWRIFRPFELVVVPAHLSQ